MIYGYFDAIGILFGDLHEFEPTTNSWTELLSQDFTSPSPAARMSTGFLAMSNSRLYLFGGYTKGGKFPHTDLY